MTNKLRSLIQQIESQKNATQHGTRVHELLQDFYSDAENTGDASGIAQHIWANPTLARLFDRHSKCEVPIAGYINGKFVTRRIDRLRIDHNAKTIDILDYKTDTDCHARREHYLAQLGEYRKLISEIYPDFKISCFILWIHDWSLEKI